MGFDLGKDNMDVLRKMRSELIEDHEDLARRVRDKERWKSFNDACVAIQESVDMHDLSKLAANVRKMKNLLRRPSVRKDLARLEGKEEKRPEGSCKCAKCGATIDGYRDCVEGALCVKCAMKKREAPPSEKEDKKDEKKAKAGVAFPPEMVGMGGGGGAPPSGGEASPAGGETEQGAEAGFEPKERKKKKKKGRFDDEDELEKKKPKGKLRKRRIDLEQ